ncbi:DUF3053 family protein [Escherichia coli]|uniref:DUF3053 family protein n=1 Tax=Escherichia coli TaxID=562 RepID=UPI003F4CB796
MILPGRLRRKGILQACPGLSLSRQTRVCRCALFLGERSKKMATGKSCSRWFAPLAALLMVVSLSGCFDKEGDQRKALRDPLIISPKRNHV